MQNFTPFSALIGGALIGLAASALLYFNNRIAGISGIVAGLIRPERGAVAWRAAFVVGLLLGGAGLAFLANGAIAPSPRGPAVLAAAGLLVGFGTRLGGGCTSGHGVCGLSRLSRRSLVATVTFMATGVAAATLFRTLGRGGL
jgi:uncharacterized membrane protein YedE/YeeE